MNGRSQSLPLAIIVSWFGFTPSVGALAQDVAGPELAKVLSRGGYVLVMRHASSPREAPTKETANADNTNLERQLDEVGRKGAAAMGDVLRALRIPSARYSQARPIEALETVRFLRLPGAAQIVELGDGGRSMQGVTEVQATWLRTRVAQSPQSGNTLIVTHQPNLARAFPDWGAAVADGETVVLRTDGKGGIRRWPSAD
jgi:phosphohistidine phosphatase SixA